MNNTYSYSDALAQFLPSEDMRTHLEANRISNLLLIELVLGAPEALSKKRAFFDEALKACPQDHADLHDALRSHLVEITNALGELEHVDENEFLYRKTMWDEQPVLPECHEAGIAPFSNIEDLLINLREEMLEEEWDEDSGCWDIVEKWRRNDDMSWSNTYSFYLIEDEPVFFERPDLKRSLPKPFRRSWKYCGSPYGLDLPTPFDVGDIIVLDCRPFMPLKYGLILEREDANHRDTVFPQVLTSRTEEPACLTWDTSSLKTGSGFQVCPPGYSLLYKAQRLHGDLPEEYAVLEELQQIIRRDQSQAVEIARLTASPICTAALEALIRRIDEKSNA